jgi:serine phosphatase RsbU (regulator of sigma subunit)
VPRQLRCDRLIGRVRRCIEGVKSLLGVPLVVERRTFSVLHVGTLSPRRFTDEDERFLQLVGDRVALALYAGLYERERAVARTLQLSFLPERLPVVPGLELAARYLPAHCGDVGGDWYDAFILPNGLLGIAVGDVVGHGITAATTMARLRNALRAYAMEFASPGEVLNRLNRLLLHFEPNSMATLLFGVVIPKEMRYRYSNAGHIPTIFHSPGNGSLSRMSSGPPLGVMDHDYSEADEMLRPDAGVILCTDGLVERRHESLELGLRRLCHASSMVGGPEEIADAIIQRLMTSDDQDDDVALLVARRS